MAALTVAKRYAKAMFELASEVKQLDPVHRDLQGLGELIRGSVEVVHFLEDPLMSAERRSAVLRSLFESKLEPVVFRFLLFLEEKKRLTLLESICSIFDELYHEHKGIVRVKIISTMPLTDDQLHQIETNLNRKCGKSVESEVVIDPSLLGGFRIVIEDEVLDFSLQTQLDRVKYSIINA